MNPQDDPQTLLRQILSEDVQLWFELGELHYKTPGTALTETQREALRNNKTLLREFMGDGRKFASASSAQKRLWFFHQYDPESPLHNLSALSLRLTGAVDMEALRLALAALVRRHEALRTSFTSLHGEPFQVIAAQMEVPLLIEDLGDLPDEARESAAMLRAIAFVRAPFDLNRGPLLRAGLFCITQGNFGGDAAQHLLLVPMHHIITDGWSIGIMLRELFSFYEAFANERSSTLPEASVQYSDYTLWRNHYPGEEVLEAQRQYWRSRLADAKPLLTFPADRERPALQSGRGRECEFHVEPQLADALKLLASQTGVSLFMVLLAGFKALVHRYTGETDIIVGSGTANRRRPELTGVCGFFVNTLVLRTDLGGRPNFRDLVQRVKEVSLDAYEHQDLPFEQLVQILCPDRDLSQTPLFQLAFILQNLPAPELRLDQLSAKRIHVDPGVAQFDLMMAVEETPQGLTGTVQYSTDLFDAETIDQLIRHYCRLLEAAADDPDLPVDDLDLLLPDEESRLAGAPFCRDFDTLQDLLEYQAKLTPDAVAACYAHQSLTYSELHARADQLACLLSEFGAGPETVVGICVNRGVAQIAATLAVIKSGAAFLPLDPGYPPQRLQFMLRDAKAALVLVDDSTSTTLLASAASGTPLLNVTAAKAFEPAPLPKPARPDNLAYIIYTSGSTGVPKGTLIEHRALPNLARWQREFFGITPGLRILQFAPMSFDAYVWELLSALANGATLCCPPADALAPRTTLATTLRDYEISMLTLPPSALSELPEGEYPALRKLVVGGEACNAALIERWSSRVELFNAYGPTEATICCAATRATDPRRPRKIGRPVRGHQLHVLDAQGRPVPQGVPGELYITGPVLARGYLNQPALSASVFAPISMPDGSTERAYRTGDIVRLLRSGEFDFLGRDDHQVKLRGCRIELGEVEAALRALTGVRDAVAIVAEDGAGRQHLIAHVVPETSDPLDPNNLMRALRGNLPLHMCPADIRVLENMPTTPNGKVDRARLRAAGGGFHPPKEPLEAPMPGIESEIARLIASQLSLPSISRFDDFFRLGGHSLLAAQLIARIHERFGARLPLRALFEQPTVAAIAAQVQEQLKTQPALPDEQDVDALSEQELDAMLAIMLQRGEPIG